MMTPKERMTLDFSEIRRFVERSDGGAAVDLIENNLHEPEMNSRVLCAIAPLAAVDAEYILSLRGEFNNVWSSVPKHPRVDFSGIDATDAAIGAAFLQLLHQSCCRVIDAIDGND